MSGGVTVKSWTEVSMSSMRQRELIAVHCGATDAFSLVIRPGYMLAKALFICVTYKQMYYRYKRYPSEYCRYCLQIRKDASMSSSPFCERCAKINVLLFVKVIRLV